MKYALQAFRLLIFGVSGFVQPSSDQYDYIPIQERQQS
jgi:hypothetical protein